MTTYIHIPDANAAISVQATLQQVAEGVVRLHRQAETVSYSSGVGCLIVDWGAIGAVLVDESEPSTGTRVISWTPQHFTG